MAHQIEEIDIVASTDDNGGANVTKASVEDKEAARLAEREKEVRKKYRRVLEGSIRKDTEGTHRNKLTVEMTCTGKGCEATRRVATSDLHQVRLCESCTHDM